MRILRLRSMVISILMAVSLLGIVSLLSPVFSVSAASNRSVAGHVYVLDNTTGNNSITSYNRFADGTLNLVGTTQIGGQGSGSGLGTQGSLIFSSDKHWLFAVDAASNQISVVAVDFYGKLKAVSVASSGGVDPVSLTFSYNRLYVVNDGDPSNAANVTGFWLHPDGTLIPIHGSTRPLSTANPAAGEVLANPTGDTLVVTEKTTNTIDTYKIRQNGSLSAPKFTPSSGIEPFGFAFNPVHPSQFVVSDAFGGNADAGAVTSYTVHNGNLHVDSGPVADNQTAPCWVVITKNGNFAYTSNTGSSSVSGYHIGRSGILTLLPSVGNTDSGSAPSEMALTDNSRFLYVLDGNLGTLNAFQVRDNGSLVAVPLTGISFPTSTTGLAAE